MLHFPTKKGQSSVELVIILSAVLLILMFIYAISQQQLSESQNRVRVSQARLSVSTIASAAREVFSEGPGSRRVVSVTIPEGNIDSRTGVFNGTIINIGLSIAEGTSDINELVEFRLVEGANFPKQPGTYLMNITSYPGYVMLGDPGYSLIPGTAAFQMLTNDSKSQALNVTNSANSSIDVTLALVWSNPSIATNLNGSSTLTFTLAPGASALINLNLVSTNAPLGTYFGTVAANGSNGANTSTSIVVQVVGVQPPPVPPISYVVIDIFSDPAYSIPAASFDPAETVDIHGTNFTANSTVTVTIRDSGGAPVFTGSNSSNPAGEVVFYWNPTGMPAGTYNASMNDSVRLNSTTFSITGCP